MPRQSQCAQQWRHNDASQYGCSTTAFSFRPQRPAAAQLPIFHFIGTTAARIAAKQRFVSAVQHEAGEERGVCHLIRRPLTAGSTCQFGKVGHFSSGFVCHALRKHMRPTGCCQHALSRTHKRTHTRAHTNKQQKCARGNISIADDDNHDDADDGGHAVHVAPAAETPQIRCRRRRGRGSAQAGQRPIRCIWWGLRRGFEVSGACVLSAGG